MKNITIKNNKKLKQLAAMFNIPAPDLAENICYRLVKADVLSDIEEECGKRLQYLFHEKGFTLKETAEKSGYYRPGYKFEMLFSGLIVWGKSNQCPQCGSIIDVEGEYELEPETGEVCKVFYEKNTCSNPCCNYEDVEDNKPDPDLKHDDR